MMHGPIYIIFTPWIIETRKACSMYGDISNIGLEKFAIEKKQHLLNLDVVRKRMLLIGK